MNFCYDERFQPLPEQQGCTRGRIEQKKERDSCSAEFKVEIFLGREVDDNEVCARASCVL
jgi:hypothetical protein